jgi:hypothetical protein
MWAQALNLLVILQLHSASLAASALRAPGFHSVIGSGCGGVGASGWGVPDEHPWFWLFQVPALELFDAVVVPAQR